MELIRYMLWGILVYSGICDIPVKRSEHGVGVTKPWPSWIYYGDASPSSYCNKDDLVFYMITETIIEVQHCIWYAILYREQLTFVITHWISVETTRVINKGFCNNSYKLEMLSNFINHNIEIPILQWSHSKFGFIILRLCLQLICLGVYFLEKTSTTALLTR